MNKEDKIVTLNEIVKRIAVLSDIDEETSRDFMQAFSRVLVEALLSKGNVDIRAIGRFVEDEHMVGNVKFEASLPLASVVNRPFSCFDPVELEDDADIEKVGLDQEAVMPEEDIIKDINEVPVSSSGEIKTEEGEEMSGLSAIEGSDAVDKDILKESNNGDDAIERKNVSEPTTVRIDNSRPLQVEIVGTEEPEKNHPFSGWKFILGLIIGLCIGIIVGILLYGYIYPRSERNIEVTAASHTDSSVAVNSSIIKADSIITQKDEIRQTDVQPETAEKAEVLKETDNKIVTDTVGVGYFLATMARKHYGSYVFWVYIYEENREKIPNPDNVAVGTVFIIPEASKYGIDAKSAESIKRAQDKANEIARIR